MLFTVRLIHCRTIALIPLQHRYYSACRGALVDGGCRRSVHGHADVDQWYRTDLVGRLRGHYPAPQRHRIGVEASVARRNYKRSLLPHRIAQVIFSAKEDLV